MKQLKTFSSGFSVEETIESLRQQLKDVTEHYHAALEAEQVRFRQLAASQAREQQLRGWVEKWCKFDALNMDLQEWFRFSAEYRALPSDNTALREMIAKAGEVMLERCMRAPDLLLDYKVDAISALPGVTLEDLK